MKKTNFKIVSVRVSVMDAGDVFNENLIDELARIAEGGGELVAVNWLTVTEFFAAAVIYTETSRIQAPPIIGNPYKA